MGKTSSPDCDCEDEHYGLKPLEILIAQSKPELSTWYNTSWPESFPAECTGDGAYDNDVMLDTAVNIMIPKHCTNKSNKKVSVATIPQCSRSARVPVEHQFNIPRWRSYEHLLSVKGLIDMLEFGFPTGFVGVKIPTMQTTRRQQPTPHTSTGT